MWNRHLPTVKREMRRPETTKEVRNEGLMNVFEFIDSCCSRAQLPYVRLIIVYVHDGVVTNVCLARYNDKKIVKKACKVGLNEDRMLSDHGRGVKLLNDKLHSDISKGDFYLQTMKCVSLL